MATYSTQKAKASWQGNYDVYGVGPGDGIRLLCFEVEPTTAQLAAGDVFNLQKFSQNTAILGGWLKTDTLDSHATPTLALDVGYDLDSGTDDPDFFFDGSAAGAAASFNANFIAGIGATAAPFVPTDDYFLTVTVQAAPATAASGTVYVYVLVGCVDSVNEALV